MKSRTIAIIISLLFLPLVVAAQGNIDPPPINNPHKPRPHNPQPQPTPKPEPQPAAKITYNSSTQEIVYGTHRYKMVYVKGGSFDMGPTPDQKKIYSAELPVHSVTLSSFYIGQTEVPQWLWKAVMDNDNPSYFKGDNLPVEYVSWNNCQEFLEILNSLTGMNFKLPTEAQWEFAARGGIHSNESLYSGSNVLGNVAWYSKNSEGKTHDVGLKESNELGLYDMSGNVYEWCQDWFGAYPNYSVTNPEGLISGTDRVCRSGSCFKPPIDCRVACRSYGQQRSRNQYLGFRLAM